MENTPVQVQPYCRKPLNYEFKVYSNKIHEKF